VVVITYRNIAARLGELARPRDDSPALGLMQQQMGQLSERLDRRLQAVNRQLRDTTGHIGERISDVKKDLGQVSQATRQVYEAARDISRLEKLLQAPKFRGGLGELLLGDLLGQILPPGGFSLQHRFKTGEIVDAVVRIGPHLVPVDSKFPYENFRRYVETEEAAERLQLKKVFVRDVKKHISDISRKYILPDEGTFDFALMYIQAENIYYETIVRDENLGEENSIFTYSLDKRVIPVSPNSFYAYLQVILLGLKGFRVEKTAREIVRHLGRLQGDFDRFKTDFELVGTHLQHARSRFGEADRRLGKFSDKLIAASELTPDRIPEETGEGEPAASPGERS